MNQGYDYIARIDCDFIITKNYLEDIVKTLDNDNNIVAASPKIIHGGLKNTIWWCGWYWSWGFLKFHKLMNLKKKKNNRPPLL